MAADANRSLAEIKRADDGRWQVVYDGHVRAAFARDEPTNAADYRNGFNDGLAEANRG